MSDSIRIAVDAMGGDNAPDVVLKGCAMALEKSPDIQITLCGPAEVVEPFAAEHDRCEAVATTQVITMEEHPSNAVRKKKDASLVVCCRLVKEGKAHGVFSAGSTGACLAASILVMGRIKGISRPALATIVPSPIKPVVMADVGANADCKPEYLVQFANMASLYASKILGTENPKVALLNIGEEDTKGSEFAQKANALLHEQVPNFCGNCEGRDILPGNFDVIVTDGFTGNVALKTIEGTASALFKAIKGIMKKSALTKVGALLLKDGLYELKDSVSADTYGGAPLLGVKGACIVGHGSSSEVAVCNGILTTALMVRENISGLIAESVATVSKPASGE